MGGSTGKAERFQKLLENHQAALEAYCRRNVRDASAVADVLQNALLAAYRDFDNYVEQGQFRAWMFRYLNLQILSYYQQSRRAQHEPLTDEPTAESGDWEDVLNEPLMDRLLEAADQVLDRCEAELAAAVWDLNPAERSALLLRSIGEFRYREIAHIMGIPMGTVMSLLSRARKKVRKQLIDCGRQRGILASQRSRTNEPRPGA